MSRPHVVVDARMAGASGIGTYARNVVPRVAHEAPDWHFTILTGSRGAEWASGENVTTRACDARIYSVHEQLALALQTPADARLFWSTHYNFPLMLQRPRVVTIHDVGHLRLEEYTRSFVKRSYARLMLGQARASAAGLLYVSKFSRDEFRQLVGVPKGAEAVVHHGVDPFWFEPALDAAPLTHPYFVYLGNIKPHKNLHTLLDAFEIVREPLGAQLVIIGRAENFRTPDPTVTARIATMSRVAFLGELDNASVRRYVRHATALVMPSVYEGFGLPPLEAMAAGCPALVSTAGSLPEVCGTGAEYFAPQDRGALAGLMIRTATDASFRKALTERGRAQARQYDWITSARRTVELLRRAMEDAA